MAVVIINLSSYFKIILEYGNLTVWIPLFKGTVEQKLAIYQASENLSRYWIKAIFNRHQIDEIHQS